MTTLAVPLTDDAFLALQQIAAKQKTTLEKLAEEALAHYLHAHTAAPRAYSFIGIGHSGQGDLSLKVEETLAKVADRREGWSLEK
ncbi:hypothetical protein HUU05_03985 [candidate division KSB1 bacterium]|nr:hypothetical protein [candidate division KSB1 bacterium]